MPTDAFPIDLGAYHALAIDPQTTEKLSEEQLEKLRENVRLCRDAIIFFTATGAARGVGGHTGGPFDTVPEVVILDALFRGAPDRFVPVFFDEAGHRVATQYLMAALHGELPAEQLTRYREGHAHLPGHPERGYTPGVKFSSGRLGHMWPYVNGVALAHPGRTVFCLGSDGSQQEGNDAEAARFAVAHGLNVKLLVDDNDVTIAGHPSDYLKGFDVARTLEGHGLSVSVGEGEDLADLYRRIRDAVLTDGPVALVNRRKMAVGIEGLEGNPKAHDVIGVEPAVAWLERAGRQAAVDWLGGIEKSSDATEYQGSDAGSKGSNRNVFGDVVNELLDEMSEADRLAKVRVIDSDLEGSCGLAQIRKQHPEVYVRGGIMERGNFSAAAGFGMDPGRQGIFGTFSAFLEMVVSELTMARLNQSNVLCHFSHAGMDDMADNTCHFGLNNFYGDNGLSDDGKDTTRLYFPADQHQMRAIVRRIFGEEGIRFVFSTRSKCPDILGADGQTLHGADYRFESGRDEVVREGTAGWIVSFGDALYRSLDAVERLKQDGLDVGLINKPTLNVVDEETIARVGAAPFVLVVESLNERTGLGIRYGTWLLERGLRPGYAHLGTNREGCGGLGEHYPHQGLDPESIMAAARKLA